MVLERQVRLEIHSGEKKWEQQEREKEEDGDKCRAEKCEEDTY